jgi:hypothetical protein
MALTGFKYKCTNSDCTECDVEVEITTALSTTTLGTAKVMIDFRLICVECDTEMSREMVYS